MATEYCKQCQDEGGGLIIATYQSNGDQAAQCYHHRMGATPPWKVQQKKDGARVPRAV